MAVVVSAETMAKVKRALDDVQSVGQAKAVIAATVTLAEVVADEVKQFLFESSWRTQARKDLSNMSEAVVREAKGLLTGEATMPVGAAWKTLRPAVSNLWFYALGAEKWFPPDETTAAERLMSKIRDAGDALAYGVTNAPKHIVRAVAATAKVATEVVGAVAKPVAGLVGGTVGALLGPIWWVVGIAAVAGVGYLLVSTGKLPIPKGGA